MGKRQKDGAETHLASLHLADAVEHARDEITQRGGFVARIGEAHDGAGLFGVEPRGGKVRGQGRRRRPSQIEDQFSEGDSM